jgi:hypothetical protein
MENTANLSLPYVMPSEAQKHVTHNEALRALDAVVQLAVLSRGLASPPTEPAEGDRHIVAAGATGMWEGAQGKVAAWQDGAWAFPDPKPGWLCFVIEENVLLLWTGADGENPFAAKLNKTLWAALATDEGGSGDLRYTLNKQARRRQRPICSDADELVGPCRVRPDRRRRSLHQGERGRNRLEGGAAGGEWDRRGRFRAHEPALRLFREPPAGHRSPGSHRQRLRKRRRRLRVPILALSTAVRSTTSENSSTTTPTTAVRMGRWRPMSKI